MSVGLILDSSNNKIPVTLQLSIESLFFVPSNKGPFIYYAIHIGGGGGHPFYHLATTGGGGGLQNYHVSRPLGRGVRQISHIAIKGDTGTIERC